MTIFDNKTELSKGQYLLLASLVIVVLFVLHFVPGTTDKVKVGSKICINEVQYTVNQDSVTTRKYLVADIDHEFDLIPCDE